MHFYFYIKPDRAGKLKFIIQCKMLPCPCTQFPEFVNLLPCSSCAFTEHTHLLCRVFFLCGTWLEIYNILTVFSGWSFFYIFWRSVG